MGFIRSFSLMLTRLALAAWIGAAGLYVVTSIREQTSDLLETKTKDQLALMRFPDYYTTGFSLVGIALVSGFLARKHASVSRGRMRFGLVMIASALILMTADYVLVYTPLVEMIDPPGKARSSEFTRYHNYSKYVNEIDVSLCIAAALVMSWTGRPYRDEYRHSHHDDD